MRRKLSSDSHKKISLSPKESESLEEIINLIDCNESCEALEEKLNEAVKQKNQIKANLFKAVGVRFFDDRTSIKDSSSPLKKLMSSKDTPITWDEISEELRNNFKTYISGKETADNIKPYYIFFDINKAFSNIECINKGKEVIREFMQLASKEERAPLLEMLGDIYLWQIYKKETNTSDFNELFLPAIKLYNGAIQLNSRIGNIQRNNLIKNKLGLIEQKFIRLCFYKHRSVGSFQENEYKNSIDSYLSRVALIRECTNQLLNHGIDINIINRFICKAMKNLLRDIIIECEDYLGIHPFSNGKCVAGGLGSLARFEITPFSDFEFIIFRLKEAENIDSYLIDLVYLILIKIQNLGETKYTEHDLVNFGLCKEEEIPKDGRTCALFVEKLSPTKRGICFDRGDITPLKTDLIHSFIGAPNELADLVFNYKKYDLDARVLSELTSFTFIHGSDSSHSLLVECEKLFQEKFKSHKNKIVKLLKRDTENFIPRLTYDKDTRKIKILIKFDIYRVFDRLIDGLALLEDVEKSKSGSDRLSELKVLKAYIQNIEEIEKAIKYFLALRLKAYLFYGAQKEDIYLEYGEKCNALDSSVNNEMYCLPHDETKELLSHYQVIKIFHFQIKDYLYLKDIEIIKIFNRPGAKKNKSFVAIGDKFKELNYFEIAESFYRDAELLYSMTSYKIGNKLGNLYLLQGKYTEALKRFNEALENEQNTTKKLKMYILKSKCFLLSNQHSDCLRELDKVFKESDAKNPFHHKVVIKAWMLRNEALAITTIDICYPLENLMARIDLTKVNNEFYKAYRGCSFLDKEIIFKLKNINGIEGLVNLKNYYQKLLDEIKKLKEKCTALKFIQAKLYNNIGIIQHLVNFNNQEEQAKARKYLKRALTLYSKHQDNVAKKLENEIKEDIANCIINLSYYFYETKQHKKAIKYAKKAINQFHKNFENSYGAVRIKMITAYLILQKSYKKIKNKSNSTKYKLKVLELNFRIYGQDTYLSLNTDSLEPVSPPINNTSLSLERYDSIKKLWNLPRYSDNFIGREVAIQEVSVLLQSEKSQPLVLTGLEGIGKTQVALYYAYMNKEKYRGGVRWLRAENSSILEADYRSFAEDMGIDIKNINIVKIISLVCEKLEFYPNSLIIFDGACSYEAINAYIPQSNKHSILITSFNQNWGTWKIIRVEEFNEAEGIQYIQKTLPNVSSDEAISLTRELAGIPLALAQVAFYLKSSYFTINKYLEISQTHNHKILINSAFPQDKYNKTVVSIISNLLKSVSIDHTATNILRFITTTHINQVPSTEKVEKWVAEREQIDIISAMLKITSSITLLNSFSVINIKNGCLYINQLIAKLVKHHFEHNKPEQMEIEPSNIPSEKTLRRELSSSLSHFEDKEPDKKEIKPCQVSKLDFSSSEKTRRRRLSHSVSLSEAQMLLLNRRKSLCAAILGSNKENEIETKTESLSQPMPSCHKRKHRLESEGGIEDIKHLEPKPKTPRQGEEDSKGQEDYHQIRFLKQGGDEGIGGEGRLPNGKLRVSR